MKATETTIIKIGNSLGARYSRAYLEKIGVKEGDRVEVTVKKAQLSTKKALVALEAISKMNGTLANIDIEKWEAERTADYEKRDTELRDILGR